MLVKVRSLLSVALRKPFGWQTFERLMAAIALANLLLVSFDASYIALRDWYLRFLPEVPQWYDPVKAIEPHRDTQKYLQTVDQLEQQLEQGGLQAPQVESLLASLRAQSVTLIDENPFVIANKSGTLEKIKNRMRDRMQEASAKQAFSEFWSLEFLSRQGWLPALGFFNRQIRPLMATNYYRPIGETGTWVDHFYQIDLFFIVLFAIEYLGRTFYLSRRHPHASWRDTLLWRWYDLFLLLPFWRLLRIIPVTLRLHQVGWIHLDRAQTQMNRFLAENLVADLSEMILVRTVSGAQNAVEKGQLQRWLFSLHPKVEINDVNELALLSTQLLQITTGRVLPQLQPELEAMLRHMFLGALEAIPLYRPIQRWPIAAALPTELAHQVSLRLTQGSHQATTKSLEDLQGQALMQQLVEKFTLVLQAELQDREVAQEMQKLLTDFLEEFKLTLIQQLQTKTVVETVAETEQIRSLTTSPSDLKMKDF